MVLSTESIPKKVMTPKAMDATAGYSRLRPADICCKSDPAVGTPSANAKEVDDCACSGISCDVWDALVRNVKGASVSPVLVEGWYTSIDTVVGSSCSVGLVGGSVNECGGDEETTNGLVKSGVTGVEVWAGKTLVTKDVDAGNKSGT
jgi:hypothetical protein